MMVTILASRLLGLVRNAVISHQFGQKYWADVYTGAFQIPDLLFYLIAGGALSSAFIPVFTEYITKGEDDKAWRVFSTVSCVMFVVIGAFVVAGEIFATPLVHIVNPGFAPGKVADTVPLTRILLPAQLCFFLGGILMGTQYARQRFLIPSLGPVVYNIGIILGGVLLAPFVGVAGLCWGAAAGAFAGNFLLQIAASRRIGMRFSLSFDWRDPGAMKVWKLMLPVVLGLALPQVSIWMNRAFASYLGDGPQAALFNANQMMQVPLGIFAQAMGVAIFPTLSALAARRELDTLRTTASSGIRSLLFLTIPSSVLMIVLATPIVQVLLQGGKYGPDDTAAAASALGFYCVGIFAWSAQSILARAFYALQDTVTPVVVGTVVTLFFIPLNWVFGFTLHMGINGLALATTVAAVIHMVVMMEVLRRRLNGFETPQLLTSFTRTTLASLGAAVPCRVVMAVMGAATGGTWAIKLHALMTVIVAGLAGCVGYVLFAWLLRCQELGEVRALISGSPKFARLTAKARAVRQRLRSRA